MLRNAQLDLDDLGIERATKKHQILMNATTDTPFLLYSKKHCLVGKSFFFRQYRTPALCQTNSLCKTSRYNSWFIDSWVSQYISGPWDIKQLHSIIEPPPNFTVCFTCLEVSHSSPQIQHQQWPFEQNLFILVSSKKTICSQSLIVQFLWHFPNSNFNLDLCLSQLQFILASSPTSQNTLLTVIFSGND